MRSSHRCLVGLAILASTLSFSRIARAGKKNDLIVSPFAYSKDDVVIDGVAPGKWTVSAGKETCDVTVAGDKKLTISKGMCPALHGVSPLTIKNSDGSVVYVTKESAASPDQTIKVEWQDGKLTKTRGDDSELALPITWTSDTKWYTAKLGDVLDRDTVPGVEKDQGGLTFYVDHGAAGLSTITVDAPAEKCKPFESDLHQCSSFVGRHPGIPYVCFSYSADSGWTLLQSAESSNVLRPNTSIAVLALVPKGDSARFALEGEPTIYEPGTSANVGIAANSTGCKVASTPVEAVFAPRAPGAHKLTITLRANSADGDATTHEFVVDKTYSGAIRLGIGAVFGGARDRGYEARTLPGSGQAEIVATQGGVLDAELVLGASAFFDKGGRSYVASEPEHWAPYLGIGILNQSATGLEVLKSVHLGIEYEISAQYSVALTLVGRKVTRLVDGLHVGDPINDMTVPTRTGYEIGIGLVFNVSPDFFKFARKSGSSFFSGGS